MEYWKPKKSFFLITPLLQHFNTPDFDFWGQTKKETPDFDFWGQTKKETQILSFFFLLSSADRVR